MIYFVLEIFNAKHLSKLNGTLTAEITQKIDHLIDSLDPVTRWSEDDIQITGFSEKNTEVVQMISVAQWIRSTDA